MGTRPARGGHPDAIYASGRASTAASPFWCRRQRCADFQSLTSSAARSKRNISAATHTHINLSASATCLPDHGNVAMVSIEIASSEYLPHGSTPHSWAATSHNLALSAASSATGSVGTAAIELLPSLPFCTRHPQHLHISRSTGADVKTC